jgi:hypothetical protein
MKNSKTTGVAFLHPLHARIVSIDERWNKACTVDQISNKMVEITADGLPPSLEEFYLVLSSVGQPVYRHCMGASVSGNKLNAKLSGKFHRPGMERTAPEHTPAKESLRPSMAIKRHVRARRNTTYD